MLSDITISHSRVDGLCRLIRNSFRVRKNHDPVYVDIDGRLERVRDPQHQVVFGRRGSGKSCLLLTLHGKPGDGLSAVYVLADEVKTLSYPDLLIRSLIDIFEQIERIEDHRRGWYWRLRRRPSILAPAIEQLRALLDTPEAADISETVGRTSTSRVTVRAAHAVASVGADGEAVSSISKAQEFRAKKIEHLERHFKDLKGDLQRALTFIGPCAVIVDDFYLIRRADQPFAIDFLHRLFRDTEAYLKIGTIRHRTSLKTNAGDGQFVGVELSQDIEVIDLDQTLENVDATEGFLARMLDEMARKEGIESASTALFNQDGLLALTLASGGVPRDYLSIFVEAVAISKETRNARWLTPTQIYKAAGRISYQTKLNQIRDDVGQESNALYAVFLDLIQFTLKEKRKTAFLVNQEDANALTEEHELIQQLMDFKLVHVIEPDTSAASGRPGRYEAYTLDFALFMEPRKRGIEHVEFWKIDEQRRRVGAREAPTYELSRVKDVLVRNEAVDATQRMREIENDPEFAPEAPTRPIQGTLI